MHSNESNNSTVDALAGAARRRAITLGVVAGLFAPLLLSLSGLAGADADLQIDSQVAIEGTYFWQDPLDPRQRDQGLSFQWDSTFYHEWEDGIGGGIDSIQFQPFARWDTVDDERSHIDIRELMWTHARDEWEMRVGIGKVFWGVTESQHLVDIINQSDILENSDGEDKLGQPMINFSSIRDFGVLDLFVLPVFRPRDYPGLPARLRLPVAIDVDNPVYTHSDGDDHIDLAVRYSHSIGAFDIGLSQFRGTTRDPRFIPLQDGRLQPIYDVVNQSGLDLQATLGDWLLKLESIRRSPVSRLFGNLPAADRYWAATVGFEYTLGGAFGTRADVGLLAEYLYDSRRGNAPTPFEDDVLIGTRWAFNDTQSTELLAGFLLDVDGDSRSLNIEASRRIGKSMKLSLELRTFSSDEPQDPLFAFSKDDHIRLELIRYF